MKTSLSHLPQHKQAELNLLTRIIRDQFPEAEMILLFGSYARDSWVEDSYVEDKVIYEYQSNILVFTGHKPKMHNLETLNKRAASLDGRFFSVFPRATEE